MTSWTAFVGQVARLRRLIARVFARAARRGRHVDEQPVVAYEPAPGPPAHWVERVRRGAPGLLEPSLRSRGEPVRPVTEHVVVPQAETESETELEPQRQSREESESEYVPADPPLAPRPAGAPSRAPSLRKPLWRKTPVLRRVLRRKLVPPAVVPAPVDPSPAPPSGDMPREPVARTKHVRQAPDPPAAAPRDARPVVDENEPRPVPAAAPVDDESEQRHHRSNVVEFEAPVERRTVRAERTVRENRPVTQNAARPPEPLAAEPPLADVHTGRIPEPAVAPQAPTLEPDVEPVQEPARRRRSGQPESPHEAVPAFRDRREPLFTVDIDRWPELPAPLDHPDDDVDAALRAWERQRRLDREQTRL